MAQFPGEQDDAEIFFSNEIKILESLPSHPNLVRYLGAGKYAGTRFLALEPLLVDAENLNGTIDRALRVVIGIGDALSCLHNAGYGHRDVNCNNIRGRGKSQSSMDAISVLMDFGLSTPLDVDRTEVENDRGLIYGATPYMQPEDTSRKYMCHLPTDKKNVRRDVYGLGVVLYKLLTHSFPYKYDKKTREINYFPPGKLKIRQEHPEVSPKLEQVVQRSLSLVDRRPMMDEFLAELKECA